jgi:hypothetical protein
MRRGAHVARSLKKEPDMVAHELENESLRLEHRGVDYLVNKRGPEDWTISTADGGTIGSLTVVSPEGEEHEPVYGGLLNGETESEFEGSDWESIVRGVINGALERQEEAQ